LADEAIFLSDDGSFLEDKQDREEDIRRLERFLFAAILTK